MLNQGPNEHKLEILEAAPSAALTVQQFPSPPALLVLKQGWSRQNSGQFAGPLGFLVKGKNVEIDAGAEYTIFVDGDRKINLKSEPRN